MNNILFTFKTKTVEIYVESMDINNKRMYQALYASGEAISELTINKEEAVSEALKAINNTVQLLVVKNDDI